MLMEIISNILKFLIALYKIFIIIFYLNFKDFKILPRFIFSHV